MRELGRDSGRDKVSSMVHLPREVTQTYKTYKQKARYRNWYEPLNVLLNGNLQEIEEMVAGLRSTHGGGN